MTLPSLSASVFSSFSDVVFGFSMRRRGVSPEPCGLNVSLNVGDDRKNVHENLHRFLGTLGISPEQVAVPKQVHGDAVIHVSKPGFYGDCDALVTADRGVFLRVAVADCLPTFLYDPSSRSVGVVHAG